MTRVISQFLGDLNLARRPLNSPCRLLLKELSLIISVDIEINKQSTSYTNRTLCLTTLGSLRARSPLFIPVPVLSTRHLSNPLLITIPSKQFQKIQMRPTQKPMIIAHRGYCSIFPQNTLQSIEAAIFKSDLVEFDVLLTKDHQVVIFHDRYLSHITDIAEIQKFKDRRRVGSYQDNETQKEKNDWWVRDFTLQELKELKVKQVFPGRPQLSQLTFRIPTLEEAITEVLRMKSKQLLENRCGFLVEIKSLWEKQQDDWDKILVEKIADLLERLNMSCEKSCNEKRFPIILQSFSHHILKALAYTHLNLPVIHLFDKVEPISEQFLSQKTVRNQIGIGITEEHANEAVRQLCNQKQWQIFYWTLRDDQADKKPFGCNNYRQAYHHLIRIGINGIITQFPEKCEEYINQLFRA